MPPTLKEFQSRVHELNREPERPLPMRLPDAAEVRFVKLTGSEEWDSFLARLQAKLNEAEKACEAWGQQALVATKDEDMRAALYAYHECNARVNTLKEVMAIPQQVIKESKGAAS